MKIQNRFEYNCSIQKLYDAIANQSSISQWWTDKSEKDSDQMVFHWQPHSWRVAMKPIELKPYKYIKWICTESNMQGTDAWKDSSLSFRVSVSNKNEGICVLEFVHDNYKSSPCFKECTAGWAFVLGKSLKSFVETGKGMPFENR